MSQSTPRPSQSIPVYPAVEFSVVNGANLGDPISFAAELDQGDTYELHKHAGLERLAVLMDEGGRFTIAENSALGRPGAALHLDCCLTMMAGTGQTTEILILVEVDDAGCVAQIYILPLAELTPRLGYTLVGIDRENARRKFAEVGCVSFSRGTHITMISGEQRAIEDLAVGDMVLTRDDGPQEVRWIGQSTVRAVGEFAPIRIKAGTLHNENDLLVSPDHRLFIYQRSDALGAGRHEVLVRARHLVNGDSVVQEDGGFVDYFQRRHRRRNPAGRPPHKARPARGIVGKTQPSPARPPHQRAHGLRSDRGFAEPPGRGRTAEARLNAVTAQPFTIPGLSSDLRTRVTITGKRPLWRTNNILSGC
jgi:hypothetical protein